MGIGFCIAEMFRSAGFLVTEVGDSRYRAQWDWPVNHPGGGGKSLKVIIKLPWGDGGLPPRRRWRSLTLPLRLSGVSLLQG